jgi:hypothetical protein
MVLLELPIQAEAVVLAVMTAVMAMAQPAEAELLLSVIYLILIKATFDTTVKQTLLKLVKKMKAGKL